MSQPKPASRFLTGILILAVVAGAGLLGIGGWFLTRSDTGPEPAATASIEEPAPETPSSEPPLETTPVAAETTSESPEPVAEAEELIGQTELAPPILVRGETPQGWAIETPDGYGFYPVGPAGPAVFSETASTGFAQSPEGAGLAAIHIIQRISVLNPDWKQAAESQLVGAPVAVYIADGEELISSLGQIDDVKAATGFKTAWIGWSVLSFDPQAAELRIAGIGITNEGESRFTLDMRLEWLDDDWRVVVTQPDFSDLIAFVAVADHGDLDIDMRSAFAL